MENATSSGWPCTKRTRLTAALAVSLLGGFAVTSCVLKDDGSTDLGSDGGGGSAATSGGSKAMGGSTSVLPEGNGAMSQLGGGAAGAPAESGSDGAGGEPAAAGGAPAEVAGIVNEHGFALEDSFFIAGCRQKDEYRCYLQLDACSTELGPDGRRVGWNFEEEFQVGGEAGKTYDITFQVNGLVEGRYYIGGVRRSEDGIQDVSQSVDMLYTGGQAPETNYHEYKLSVFQQDGETEVEHYFLNSMPAQAYEAHMTFLASYQMTITVPGQGVIRYSQHDRDCFTTDNCGEGDIGSGEPCDNARGVPNEPGLVLPEAYGGEPLSVIGAAYPDAGDAQPWHAQLLHLTVTNVVENP